jgi:dihydrofolate reductase
MPEVADGMNRMEKIVFSRTVDQSDWQNTRFLAEDPVPAMRRLKETRGPDMTLLGSGSIVAPLAAAGLIDTYQLVVCPIALGAGRTMLDGLPQPVRLRQTHVRAFKNGKVYISYERAG